MKCLFSNKARGFLSMITVVFSAVLWVGCGDMVDPVTPNQPSGGDNPLVLPSGWAWTDCNDYSYSCHGVIFTEDGRIIEVGLRDYDWVRGDIGTYTINGNWVTVAFPNGDPRNGTWSLRFSPDGQTLTATPGNDVYYGGTMSFTKTSGVNVVIPPANPAKGGNLVLGSGQAWRFNDDVNEGYQFLANGTVYYILSRSGNWSIYGTGTYTTNNGNVTIRWNEGRNETLSYSVSGNTLTISYGYDYGTYTLSVVSGVSFSSTGVDTTSPPPIPGTGGNLVLSSGQAWRFNDWTTVGYQFLANGTVYGTWYTSGSWTIDNTGTYTTNNGTVTIYWNSGDNETWSYSVSGNTLTISYGGPYDTYTLSVVSGVNFSTPAGGNLVLSSGQAWIGEYGDMGMIFQSGGGFSLIEYYNGRWEVSLTGTYATTGGNITINVYGDIESGTYTVSGNTLYMTLSGESGVFTKTSGINVVTPTGGSLVLPYGQAWTYGGDDYWDYGYIFESSGYVKSVFKEYGDWYILDEGLYETSGNRITISWYSEYGTDEYWYSISGNTLILGGEYYTKTSGVYPDIYYAPSKLLGKRPNAGDHKKPKLFRQKAGAQKKPLRGAKGSDFLAKK